MLLTILSNNPESNLKDLLNAHQDMAVEVAVRDRFILFDVDTPEDYQVLLETYKRKIS